MKKLFVSLGILLFAAPCAQGADSLSGKSDLNNMLGSLSNMLASTNPKTVDYKEIEPASGEAVIASQPDERIRKLPPLVKPVGNTPPDAPAVILSPISSAGQPIKVPVLHETIDRDELQDSLSPETKKILRATKPGFGNQPKRTIGDVNMSRGGFDNQATTEGEPAGLETVKEPEPPKVPFDIKVQSVKNTNSTINYLEKARSSMQLGEYESAVASYKAALAMDKNNRDAMFGLATSYHRLGQRKLAREAYGSLLKRYPAFEPGFNNMLVFASEEAPSDALKELDILSAKNPNFATIYAQKAVIYSKIGDIEGARKNMVKAVNLKPNSVTYRYNLAILLDTMGDYAGARTQYTQLLEQNDKGANLPVEREQISERLNYLNNLPKS